MREQLLKMAESESEKYRQKVQTMDKWIMSKKMDLAENISGVEDLEKLDGANQELLDQQHTSSFK